MELQTKSNILSFIKSLLVEIIPFLFIFLWAAAAIFYGVKGYNFLGTPNETLLILFLTPALSWIVGIFFAVWLDNVNYEIKYKKI